MDRKFYKFFWKFIFLLVLLIGYSFVPLFGVGKTSCQLEILERMSFDPKSPSFERNRFTQGLYFDRASQSIFYSAGLYGRSQLHELSWNEANQSWHSVLATQMPPQYFGEGLVLWKEKLYQLTWKSERVMVYNRKLEKIDEKSYRGEGWGLTHDGQYFIRSDGSDTLFFHGEDFQLIRKMTVRDGRKKVKRINALQYYGKKYRNKHRNNYKNKRSQKLLANIWFRDFIAVIDIDKNSGQVHCWIDGRELVKREFQNRKKEKEDVLNGIAYDEVREQFFLTGKNWNHLYRVKITEEIAEEITE